MKQTQTDALVCESTNCLYYNPLLIIFHYQVFHVHLDVWYAALEQDAPNVKTITTWD